jgi:hypothetical protein
MNKRGFEKRILLASEGLARATLPRRTFVGRAAGGLFAFLAASAAGISPAEVFAGHNDDSLCGNRHSPYCSSGCRAGFSRPLCPVNTHKDCVVGNCGCPHAAACWSFNSTACGSNARMVCCDCRRTNGTCNVCVCRQCIRITGIAEGIQEQGVAG